MAALVLAAPIFTLAWFQIFSFETATASDDGLYAITAQELRNGGDGAVVHIFENQRQHDEFNALGTVWTEDGVYLASRHRWWAAVQAAAMSSLGDWALRLPSVAGVVASVLAATELCRAIGRGRSVLLVGVLVLSSPILYNGLQLWAHAAVAAAITAALIGSVRLLTERPAPVPIVLLVGGGAVASCLRGDGFVFALAVAVGLGACALLRSIRERHLQIGALTVAAVAAATSSASFLLTSKLAATATGVESAVSGAVQQPKVLQGIWSGFLATVLATPRGEPLTFVLLLTAAASTAMALVSLRRRAKLALMVALLLVAAGALFVRLLVDPEVPATGLVAAWPIVLFALARPWHVLNEGERMILVASALGGAGVLLAQYSDGAGVSWGGRYLVAAVPGLCVLIGTSLDRLAPAIDRLAVRPSTAAGVLVVASFLSMLQFDSNVRARYETHWTLLDRLPDTGVFVTALDHIGRADWVGYPERQWLHAAEGPLAMQRIARFLDEKGVRQFTAYGVTFEHAEWLLEPTHPGINIGTDEVFYGAILVQMPHGVASRRASVVD